MTKTIKATAEQQEQIETIMNDCKNRLEHVVGAPVNVMYRIKVNHINPQLIINFVCHVQKVTYSQLLSKSQEKPLVVGRHLIMWLTTYYCRMTAKAVAELVNRERSNVSQSIKLVNDMLDNADPLYITPIEEIEKLILNVVNV